MKKFALIIFLILNTFIFSSALNRDIDIIDMPLHEVLAVLSKTLADKVVFTSSKFLSTLIFKYEEEKLMS